ncbi:MAG: fatty-acid oxidation protein subunit alpha [Leptolyngbya sp.]|nr:MAG: fatty-acid oxidation protein subunit alpha [Leptolyngbya sp.]
MSAKDVTHTIVRHALEKDGWIITHDPYYIKVGGVELYIDLGADAIVAAERAGQKIAVEVKSFLGASSISEFHTALGQFFNYRLALEEKDPDRILYLAVPLNTYDEFFTLQFIQKAVQRADLKLLIYNELQEAISQWIP